MTQSSMQALLLDAERWKQGDPDEASATAMGELIAKGDEAALRACFEPPLEFGTAGLRGVVGPGPAQMNEAVVRRVTRALTEVVAAQSAGLPLAPMVVGFDGRLDSRRFAEQAVGVVAAAGFPVAYFDQPTPTPVVAFAGLRLEASASVVVTASHNPPEYNGYKVYGAEGIQIVPPYDLEVSRRFEQTGPANQIAIEGNAYSRPLRHGRRLGEETLAAYVEAVVSGRVPKASATAIRIAYSPLHGVGASCFERVFRRAGYGDLHIEPSQRDIDGHFPSVSFPNPEEPATLARALALAERISADLMIVNDPDADRMGVALPDHRGIFRILSGNEIGIILTDYLLAHAPEPQRAVVIASLVSTPMTALVARHYGAHFEQALTGFKWLWTAMRILEAERGLKFALCWEEALGYSTHRAVRDKDGIAAGLCFADWVSECKTKRIVPLDRLAELYRRHGAWGSAPCSLTRSGPDGLAEIQGMLGRLRDRPPCSVLERKVIGLTDYSRGAEVRPVYRGAAPMIILDVEGDARIVVRPSGTEPKLKVYADVREAVGASEDPFVAYERARTMAGLLAEALASSLS
ncbi:MAG: phospho-sugar mutase [Betaproteobacteria bacterium]|nr:phospho-sugar mutase [Betaproteobacteria bacterium]